MRYRSLFVVCLLIVVMGLTRGISSQALAQSPPPSTAAVERPSPLVVDGALTDTARLAYQTLVQRGELAQQRIVIAQQDIALARVELAQLLALLGQQGCRVDPARPTGQDGRLACAPPPPKAEPPAQDAPKK